MNERRNLLTEAAAQFKHPGINKAIRGDDIEAIKIMKTDHFNIGYDPTYIGPRNYNSISA